MYRSLPQALLGVLVLTSVLVLTPVGSAAVAQSSESVEAGDRVRLASQSVSGEYLVEALLPDSIVLRDDSSPDDLSIETRSLYRIEVYRGRSSRLTGALEGLLAGGVVGGLVSLPCSLPHMTCESMPPAERALVAAGVGAVLGMVVRGGREIWEEVRIPGQVNRVPTRYADADTEGGANSGRPSGPDFISETELRSLGGVGDQNVYEYIRRERPNWLRARTIEGVSGQRVFADVYVDSAPRGGPDVLQDFHILSVTSIEFVDPRTAGIRFGLGHQGGVIHVRTQ